VLAAIVVVGIIALASGKITANGPTTHTVTGTFQLTDSSIPSSIEAVGGTCHGTGGYSDLVQGIPVILKDESGTVLSSGTLSDGVGTTYLCDFTFTLPDVPDTAKFYVVSVSHRGQLSQSHAEMETSGWTFSLSMGN